mmetsp:Transcript_29575/g.62161  ORF Transcript_29575/g.62161 Transcript_29575/m.62161 type:complete len:207 (-) Transcript_29575:1742-2362(-)
MCRGEFSGGGSGDGLRHRERRGVLARGGGIRTSGVCLSSTRRPRGCPEPTAFSVLRVVSRPRVDPDGDARRRQKRELSLGHHETVRQPRPLQRQRTESQGGQDQIPNRRGSDGHGHCVCLGGSSEGVFVSPEEQDSLQLRVIVFSFFGRGHFGSCQERSIWPQSQSGIRRGTVEGQESQRLRTILGQVRGLSFRRGVRSFRRGFGF